MRKPKRDPLAEAQRFLPGFDRDTMTVHGRVVSVTEAIRRTNAIFAGWGMEQLDANPDWVVKTVDKPHE